MRRLFSLSMVCGLLTVAAAAAMQAGETAAWSKEKANEWANSKPWLVGANFSPSTAINQLEMWQADSFDLVTIDRELGWAEELGFNSMRVFLHNLLWEQDQKGFLDRLEKYLAVADKHGIGTVFVLLDGCWDPFPKLGKQREPKPHVHNPGWVQAPGAEILKDPTQHGRIEAYIKGVVGHFRADKRILAWDVFNEVDNDTGDAYRKVELKNKADLALALLKKAMVWAREAKPSQPLTVCAWQGPWNDPAKITAVDKFALEESDIISFHNYDDPAGLKVAVDGLKRYGKPMICTEYMARPRKSTFDPLLGYLKEQHIGAMNWGFVSGKTQTIYPWDTWTTTYTAEPPVWFHDILRPDGRPFSEAEAAYIKKTTGAKPGIR